MEDPNKTQVLFILKKKMTSGGSYNHVSTSSGLFNSAKFVVDMLNANHKRSAMVVVNDNNDIDRELTKYKPKFCVIEALWVVPEKFEVLQRLHPKVKFIVRVHSEIPFLAIDGIAIEWIKEYLVQGIFVSFNSSRTNKDFQNLYPFAKNQIVYLPNYYPVTRGRDYCYNYTNFLEVGAFGSIRPLKNFLIQAVAAMRLADEMDRTLIFSINAERVEQGGDPNLRNIRALFAESNHILKEYPWLPHTEFLKIVQRQDLGMQMSFSESYNIVSADFVNNNIPMVTSKEVEFISSFFQADPTSVDDIVQKMKLALKSSKWGLQSLNKRLLKTSSKESEKTWLKLLKH